MRSANGDSPYIAMPRRTQPSRASGSASAAWEAAMCVSAGVRPRRAASASASWKRARAARSSASLVLERWLKMPTTRSLPMRSSRAASANAVGRSPGARPLRPRPVSTLSCTSAGRAADAAAAAAASWSRLEMPSSIPCATASVKDAPGACSHARIGASMPARRSASASPMSATPRRFAPPASAATAERTAPWPYPSALTTAITSEDVRRRTWRTLSAIASVSMSASRIVPAGRRVMRGPPHRQVRRRRVAL